MPSINRRRFMKRALGTAAASSLACFPLLGRSAESAMTRILIDPMRRKADLDRRLFGSFLEHIGRAIYTGIYEPGSKLADKDGFRKDVLEEIRRLGVPTVRYPGGNFVSGYHWQDGVGPKAQRRRVLDRAWNSIETNQFGTDEFIAWCRAVGTEPLLAVNLGTGTPENAAALVEYCNAEKDTRWSDLRRKHGHAAPHAVKHWCLGNEMDGKWQIGHMSAVEYGRKAADAARQMRVIDRSIQLIACGSTAPFMPTYLEWDRQTLEQCYDDVDAISLHRYFNKPREVGTDSARFLALNLTMDRQIDEVAAVCDMVRTRLRSKKKLWLSFDEWNVWYRAKDLDGRRQEAPRLVEEVYSLEDALLVGGTVNTLIRHADRVKIGCLAQLVNVIAPLLTNSEKVLRQTIYYPYAWALQYARGQVLDVWVESPAYDVPDDGRSPIALPPQVPYVDVAATIDSKTNESSIFLLNRDLAKEREVEIIWRESAPRRVLACQVLTGTNLEAQNTFEQPDRVKPQALESSQPGERMRLKLPPRAYVVLHLGV